MGVDPFYRVPYKVNSANIEHQNQWCFVSYKQKFHSNGEKMTHIFITCYKKCVLNTVTPL